MIDTARLTLRGWRGKEDAPSVTVRLDGEAMRHLGDILENADPAIRAAIDAYGAGQAAHVRCCWTIERRGDGAFLGFCGLCFAMDHRSDLDFDQPFFAAGHTLSHHIAYVLERPAGE